MADRRPCARCKNPLSKERLAKRKKYCFHCECTVKREQKQRAHDRRVEKEFGLDPGDYQRMYEAQGGKCAIQGCRARGLKIALAVDHDHKCDQGHPKQKGCKRCVRGLLCRRHNREIGYNGDDPLVFLSLYNYLIDPPARRILDEGLSQERPGARPGRSAPSGVFLPAHHPEAA